MSNELEVVSKAFDELQSVSGKAREHKLAELLTPLDEDAQYIYNNLRFLLDTDKVTGISSKKLSKEVTPSVKELPNSLYVMLSIVTDEPTGKDEMISFVKSFIDNNAEYKELIEGLVTKSLKLGLTKTTVNKVIRGNNLEGNMPLIPDFKVQLAKNVDSIGDKLEEDSTYLGNVAVTEKLDGIRAVAINNGEGFHVYARSGKEITNLEHITGEIEQAFSIATGDIVLDGELTVPAEGLAAEDEFRQTASIVNSDKDKSKVVYNVFDMLTKDQFNGLEESGTYTERRNMLDKDLVDTPHIRKVPLLGYAQSMSDVEELFDRIIQQGGEGVMLNTVNGKYERKRTKNLWKVKQENSVDLMVTGLEEGTGKYKGMLGALKFNYKGNELYVGTGLSDEERNTMWDNKDTGIGDMVGRIVEVAYTTESTDVDGNYSLRFPRFKGIREDKLEESYN
jgi:DNA ligase-1